MCTDSHSVKITSIPLNTDVRRSRVINKNIRLCEKAGMQVQQLGVCNQMTTKLSLMWGLTFWHSESVPIRRRQQGHVACTTLSTYSKCQNEGVL